ncbi:MAG: DUF5597 domain-containing protein [Chitinophagaceae bacterium]
MIERKTIACLFVLLSICSAEINAQQNDPASKLTRKNGVAQLQVKGKPFLILGGETGNSSASDMSYMRPYWQKFKAMHLNTILAPVYWELMEPEEGRFDFSLVDSLLNNAHVYNLKLVLLWFGTWKNSMSCYVPLWMKKNPQRFERTLDKNGNTQEIISCFSKPALEADKKAFAALMKYLREKDTERCVIMVQVENEIGMLPTAREISKTANSFFNSNVPSDLVAYLKKHKDSLEAPLYERWKQSGFTEKGNWEKLFGEGLATDEIFQAWYYAQYANAVAAAGKAVYNVPMYVNAALNRPNAKPGDYPSAGPLPHVMDIWRAAAPSIDIFSPDFYNPDTKYWCDLYAKKNNPLFIPEMRLEASCAAKVFFLIGHYKAIGFSPFSIEDAKGDAESALTKSYDVLTQLRPYMQDSNYISMDAVLLDKQSGATTLTMGDYYFRVSHDNTLGWTAAAKDSAWQSTGAIIIQTGKDDFLVAGTGVVINFSSVDAGKVANIAWSNELNNDNGKLKKGRRMNGDQDHQGRHIRIPVDQWGIQQFALYESLAKAKE